MKIQTAFKYSFLLHVAIMVIAVGHIPGCGQGGGEGEPQNNSEKMDIIPKISDEPIEVEMMEMPVEEPTPEYQKAEHKDQECADFFGGIGVTVNYLPGGGQMITEVYSGYPAQKAGLQPGMVLLNSDQSDPIRGEVGTMVDIRIREDGGVRVMQLVRDKICYEAKP